MRFDVHAHLDYKGLIENIEDVIRRAKEADVNFIINSGTSHEGNLKSLELSEKYDIVKAGLGLYPTHCLEMSDKEIESELRFIKENKDNIMYIGEIGLDFKEAGNKEKQIKNFTKILKFSKGMGLPVLIHSRKAEKEAIEILEAVKVEKVIMHCFSGRFKLIEKIIRNRWYFSIPAIITFSMHFQKLAEKVPLNFLLTETDAPFLSPIKEKINEPANVRYTIRKIAEIKNLEEKEVEKMLFMNFQKIFMR